MKRRTRIVIAVVVVAIAAAIPTVAIASGESDTPITGPALEKASDAAIAHLGEGTVTETEIDDEESKYEVEVTLPDGSQVDVQLDENFNVVGSEGDSADDEQGGADD